MGYGLGIYPLLYHNPPMPPPRVVWRCFCVSERITFLDMCVALFAFRAVFLFLHDMGAVTIDIIKIDGTHDITPLPNDAGAALNGAHA